MTKPGRLFMGMGYTRTQIASARLMRTVRRLDEGDCMFNALDEI
jgi:hypothetical protein